MERSRSSWKPVSNAPPLVLGLVCALSFAPAMAENGPAHTGMSASADSAATVYFNPAGLTQLDESETEVQVLLVGSQSNFNVSATNVSGNLTTDSDSFLAIPSFYYARPLGERWSTGASISITGGIGDSYDDDWVGRYFVQEWGLAFVGFTPAIAYEVNDTFSIGAGVTFNYAIYKQESAVRNLNPSLGDGSMELDADDFLLSYTASALFTASSRTRFGLVWRSETEPELSGEPEFDNLGPLREQQLRDAGVIGSEVKIRARMPQSVLAGLYHEFRGGSALTFDALWLDFSSFGLPQIVADDDSLEALETEYEDMWVLTLGGRWPLNRRWDFLAGGLYVTEAVENENRTFALRLDSIWGAGVGFRRKVGRRKAFTVNVNYYDLGDAPIETEDVPLVGSISGEYSTHHALLVDFSYRWKLSVRR